MSFSVQRGAVIGREGRYWWWTTLQEKCLWMPRVRPYGSGMEHWEVAVGDLAELVAAEQVAVTLAERLAGSIGAPISIMATDGARLTGPLIGTGPGWAAIRTETADQLLTPRGIAAIFALGGPAAQASALPIGIMLRRIANWGLPVTIDSGIQLRGSLARVSADHFDVQQEPGSYATIPIAALRAIRADRGVLTRGIPLP